MVSDVGILPWLERLRGEVPGLELLDVHTHIGFNDPDGYSCGGEELLAALERIDGRAVVFPMHELDGYPPQAVTVLRGELCAAVGP